MSSLLLRRRDVIWLSTEKLIVSCCRQPRGAVPKRCRHTACSERNVPGRRTMPSDHSERASNVVWAICGTAASIALLYSIPALDQPISAETTTNKSSTTTTACEARRFNTFSGGPRNVMLAERRSIRARTLEEKYKVDWLTVLGEGAYGTVYPARLAATGEKVALKKISKQYTAHTSFRSETDALLRIYDNGGHPNISGLRDMYEDESHYFLILDLVSGGEMFEHLINDGSYSEADSARLMHEVASALAFMHGVGVVHADLKPENLLLCSKNRLHGTIKIIDFGCAVVSALPTYDERTNDRDSRLRESFAREPITVSPSTGTYAYWAPERFQQGTVPTPAMDMWSVGVILYIMLTGVHPFDINGKCSDDQIARNIRENPHPPLSPEFVGHLSESAIDLISKLMNPDPQNRLTAYQMLHHPWVRGETASTEKIPDSDKKLSSFKDLQHKLEVGIFSVLVSQGHRGMSFSERPKSSMDSPVKSSPGEGTAHLMKRAFDVFDSEGKGFVTLEDLGRVVSERTSVPISTSDARDFASSNGTLGSGSATTNFSLSDFASLFSRLKHKHFPRGHVIFNAGDTGDSMYFLNSGKVEVLTRKGQLVAILRSGDFFGEGSLLSKDNRRFTTAKCTTPVDVIQISRADFDRYVASSESTKNELRIKWRARHLDYAKNLIRLQSNVVIKEYKKGDVVYREGDKGMSMFRVDDNGGELEVSHGNKVVHRYLPGDTFGESALLFQKPRSSTVTCKSDTCRLMEMRSEDFLAMVEASPEVAATLRDMCRKRLFKKAIKHHSLKTNRGLSDEDIVAAFHDADKDKSGSLNLDEVRHVMRGMDPEYPDDEIRALLQYVDVDEDGNISLEEFKRLFRQFEDEKKKSVH